MGKVKRPKPETRSRLGLRPNPSTHDYNKDCPKFSFQYLQRGYCISDCGKDEKALLLDSLHKRSQMTWQQIINATRHGLGSELIPKHQIKTGIPQAFVNEESFMSLRAIEKAPMVGVRVRSTYYVIWVDRAFTLYDHG